MEKLKKYLAYFLLLIVVFFNMAVLKGELQSLFDVNDNVFAFCLIERANKNWQECINSGGNIVSCYLGLLDHWNSTWAMGYPLPHFYQHLPANAIVFLNQILGSFAKFLPHNENIFKVVDEPTLYIIFNFFKYLMLCFYPVVIFFCAKKLKMGNTSCAIASLSSFLIANNFQYGTSWESIIWRGSGMYTQLWGMFFLPLALVFCFDTICYKKNGFWGVFFLVLTIESQLGFGFMVAVSVAMILGVQFLDKLINGAYQRKSLAASFWSTVKGVNIKGFLMVFVLAGMILSYWLIPLFLNSNYHNHSVWDDLLKFNSFGARKIISRLINGEVFDYWRKWPGLTILVMIGFLVSLIKYFGVKEKGRFKDKDVLVYLYLPVLFLTWLLFYFGRTTWGGIIDLIPLSGSMHWHRVINGVHLAGIFLIGIGGGEVISRIYRFVAGYWKEKGRREVVYGLIFFVFVGGWFYPAAKERYLYVLDNNRMIVDYNKEFMKEWGDLKEIIKELRKRPKGRIYLGKPGQWGSKLKIGGQSLFMTFSVAGFDVLGFLPETWSPNSDIEQFFDEENEAHYRLFDIRYVVASDDYKAAEFLKVVKRAGRFVVYETPSKRVFKTGVKRGVILTNKRAALNFNRFIIESPAVEEMNLWEVKYKGKGGEADLKTTDWITYEFKGEKHSLFEKNPFKEKEKAVEARFWNEKQGLNSYGTMVELPEKAMVLLSATYHPFWEAKVDKKEKEVLMISPALMGVEVEAGKHKIEFNYKMKDYKKWLVLFSFLSFLGTFFVFRKASYN